MEFGAYLSEKGATWQAAYWYPAQPAYLAASWTLDYSWGRRYRRFAPFSWFRGPKGFSVNQDHSAGRGSRPWSLCHQAFYPQATLPGWWFGVKLSFVHLSFLSASAMSFLLLSFRRYLPTMIERRYLVSISPATLSSYGRSPLPATPGFHEPSEAVRHAFGKPSPASQFPSPFLSQGPGPCRHFLWSLFHAVHPLLHFFNETVVDYYLLLTRCIGEETLDRSRSCRELRIFPPFNNRPFGCVPVWTYVPVH